jgi:hypothetical protein
MPRITVHGITINVVEGTELTIDAKGVVITRGNTTVPLMIAHDDGKRIVTRQFKSADANAASNRFQGHSTGKIDFTKLPKGLDRKIVAYMRKNEGRAYQRGISLAFLPKAKRTALSAALKHYLHDMVETGELCILNENESSQTLYGLTVMQDRNPEPQPQPEPINSWNIGNEHNGATELIE